MLCARLASLKKSEKKEDESAAQPLGPFDPIHLTGPRYWSSQARVSLIISFVGGSWSVSYNFSCLSGAGVPKRSTIGFADVSGGEYASYLPFKIKVGILTRLT